MSQFVPFNITDFVNYIKKIREKESVGRTDDLKPFPIIDTLPA
jgi:hypothetical protein